MRGVLVILCLSLCSVLSMVLTDAVWCVRWWCVCDGGVCAMWWGLCAIPDVSVFRKQVGRVLKLLQEPHRDKWHPVADCGTLLPGTWHPVAHASGASLTVHLLSVRLLTQAQKFPGTKHETLIRKARSPGEAAKMGRDRSRPLRRDWARVKEDIMLAALRAKFKQHRRLRSVLLSTGDAKLVEHTHNDRYWGA